MQVEAGEGGGLNVVLIGLVLFVAGLGVVLVRVLRTHAPLIMTDNARGEPEHGL